MTKVTHRWLTVEEAADYLRCSERYLRERLTNDQVPHTMFAGKALFLPDRLDTWLLSKETELDLDTRKGVEEKIPSSTTGDRQMNEADMERLIRDYPNEFFDEPLKLVSQQEQFRSGITDLIFEDAQGDLIVLELKRGILQREHIAQIIDYLEDVENRYSNKHVELMVVANIIPSQRRTKLERLGVSFKEITEARFKGVAKQYGVTLSESDSTVLGGITSDRVEINADLPREEVASLITELINYGERFVSGLGNNLKQDVENSDYASLSLKTYAQLSRWCHPHRYTSREQWVQPIVHKISEYLFGKVIQRTAHPSYGR